MSLNTIGLPAAEGEAEAASFADALRMYWESKAVLPDAANRIAGVVDQQHGRGDGVGQREAAEAVEVEARDAADAARRVSAVACATEGRGAGVDIQRAFDHAFVGFHARRAGIFGFGVGDAEHHAVGAVLDDAAGKRVIVFRFLEAGRHLEFLGRTRRPR